MEYFVKSPTLYYKIEYLLYSKINAKFLRDCTIDLKFDMMTFWSPELFWSALNSEQESIKIIGFYFNFEIFWNLKKWKREFFYLIYKLSKKRTPKKKETGIVLTRINYNIVQKLEKR